MGGGLEKNSLQAFEKAFRFHFGVETDIRDFNSKLVISHDIATQNCLSVEEFFALYKEHSVNKDATTALPLALNIKADGLQNELLSLLQKYEIVNYFVFDMSVPDALCYLNKGFKAFSRLSEYEEEPSFYDEADGLWLDEFHSHFIDEALILGHLKQSKKLCIVSPELHQRAYEKEWQEYKNIIKKHKLSGKIMLCTDEPIKAQEFFNEN